MKPQLSQLYLAQATQCQEAASQAVLANVRRKNEEAEASWRAMAALALGHEAEKADRQKPSDTTPAQRGSTVSQRQVGASPAIISSEETIMATTANDPKIPAAANGGADLDLSADTSGGETATAEEFAGLDNDLVNVGKFNDTAAPPKPGEKDPSIPVAEAFGISEQNLHRSDESDELKEAVASLS